MSVDPGTVTARPEQRARAVPDPLTASPSERTLVAAILADAFTEDPVFRFLVGDDRSRPARLARLFESILRIVALPHRETRLTADGDAAAVWLPPGTTTQGIGIQLRLLPAIVAAVGARGLPGFVRVMSAMERHHPQEPHFYLMLLGVRRGRQGQGIGSALLRSVLERCDRERIPAYLEASSPRNVGLYERHGFVATGRIELPDGGPSMWPMWREPVGSVSDGGFPGGHVLQELPGSKLALEDRGDAGVEETLHLAMDR